MDGAGTLILILILSFVIERVATGLEFVLSFSSEKVPTVKKMGTKTALAHLCAAALVVINYLWFGGRGILFALNVPILEGNSPAFTGLDGIVTAIVLAGGASQLGALKDAISKATSDELNAGPIQITGTLTGAQREATAEAKGNELAPEQIQITGTLTLDEESRKALASGVPRAG